MDPNSQYIYLIPLVVILISGSYFLSKELRKIRLWRISIKLKYFKSLVNFSPQPLVLKNKEGKVIFASRSIKDLLNLKKGIARGKGFEGYICPDDIFQYKKFLEDVINNPLERKSTELRMRKGKTGWIWTRVESINLLDNEDIKAIVSNIQDISFQKELDREKIDIIQQEKKARQLVESAINDRDEFLSIASHELKTPLTTILLQLQSTLRHIQSQSLADFSGEKLLNSLRIAEQQSTRLGDLIKDLLDVSLASTQKINLRKEKINLAEFVESFVNRFEAEIKLSGSSVRLRIPKKELSGVWDHIRVEQAMSNLLINALKYSSGKTITIKVRARDNMALIHVVDQGVGIKRKYQKKIFEPFQRANKDNDVEGLGVGLFIAKRIALAHGGDIELESEVGKGSTFTLKLPLESAENETMKQK